jgi:hypothetical protein
MDKFRIAFGFAIVTVGLGGWTATRWVRQRQYKWEQVVSPDAQFRISFPSSPTASEEQSSAADGTQFHSNRLVASPRKGVIYAVSWWQNPAQTNQSTDDLFAKFRDCNVEIFHGKILNEKKLTVQGYSAQDTEVLSSGGFIVHDRTIRAGPRIYSVWVFDSSGNRDPNNAYKFFDSLVLN